VNARFYAPTAGAPDEIVELPEEEAQHLTRVLRLKPGDAVRVFNGRGDEFDGVVEEISKAVVRIKLGAPRGAAQEAGVSITLAQAVLKGDRMDDVVRDAVMMGVAAIQPVITTRAEVFTLVSPSVGECPTTRGASGGGGGTHALTVNDHTNEVASPSPSLLFADAATLTLYLVP